MPWDAVKGVSFFLGKCEARRLRSRRAVAESLLLACAQALNCLIHGYSKPVLRAAEACLTQKTAKPCRHLAASGKFVR